MRLVDVWVDHKLVVSIVMYQNESVAEAILRVRGSIVVTSNVPK
jgi:hypothetical protein